jgi:hypothetical protein
MAATALEINFDRKLEIVTSGLAGEFSHLLQDKIPREDALTVMGLYDIIKGRGQPICKL